MGSILHDEILQRFRAVTASGKLRDRPPSYTRDPRDNLVGSLRVDVLEDFASGSGGELDGDLPKFCAVHSSSALAANSFGPARLAPDCFGLAGVTGFEKARFERQSPNGLRGTPPNLDFVAWGAAGTVAVESKFTEMLSPKVAKFSPPYAGAMQRLSDPAWMSMFESLLSDPRRFTHLDAAQLVKHYLGMRNSLKDAPGELVLMYAFWEPANAETIPEFAAHRAEIEEFATDVAGSPIRFAPMSHAELWRDWERSSTWPGLSEHLVALRARYEWKFRPQAT